MTILPEFSWTNVVPTLIGGAISLTTTVVMFQVSQRNERKKKQADAKKRNAFLAYAGFQKIMKTAQAIISLDRHLTKEFNEAVELGKENDDPANLVRPILHDPIMIEDVSVEEAYFLAQRGKAKLLLEIHEIQQRARNNNAIVREFNRHKEAFQDYLDSKLHAVKEVGNSHVGFGLEGEDAIPAMQRMGHMNSILGALLPALDEDIPRVKTVVEEFLSEAKLEFGDDFPKTKIIWLEEN